MTVVATDLDGTLLDPGATLGAAARGVLARLRAEGIPVVPLTSKTSEELAFWIREIGAGPFGSFENGAGIVGPGGIEIASGAVDVKELSRALRHLARSAQAAVRPLPDLSEAELCRRTGLSGDAARRARGRKYDLPFLAPDGSGERLACAIAEIPGLALARGGVFWHLTGRHDKGSALARLLARHGLQGPVIGLGDAGNDAPFLERCDVVALIPAAGGVDAALRDRFPGARVAGAPGGAGWAESIGGLMGIAA